MERKIILVDQDVVMADFLGSLNGTLKKMVPADVFVELDDWSVYHLEELYPDEYYKTVQGVITSPGFFLNLPVIPGAIEAVNEMVALGHEVLICTVPFPDYENCVLEKFQWVENHLGRKFTERIIMSQDKTIISGDILIDDHPEIKGINPKPTWHRIIFDAPYNKSLPGPRLTDWKDWQQVIN